MCHGALVEGDLGLLAWLHNQFAGGIGKNTITGYEVLEWGEKIEQQGAYWPATALSNAISCDFLSGRWVMANTRRMGLHIQEEKKEKTWDAPGGYRVKLMPSHIMRGVVKCTPDQRGEIV